MSASTVTSEPGRSAELAGRLFKSWSGSIGFALTLSFAVLAIAGSLGLLVHDPLVQNPPQRLVAPSLEYWMGTDQFGRDVFARVAVGVANSMKVALLAIAVAAVVGTAAGVAAGYFRKWLDGAIAGFSDILLAFPSLLLALSLASVLDRNWVTVALAISVVYVPLFVRVSRAPVLALREVDFVAAAKVTGMSSAWILARHVVPNIVGILIVQCTLATTWAILTEASLSFLGFGTPPPAPSLGVMILDSRSLVGIAPWLLIGPGAAMFFLVAGLNLLGDALQSVFDPRKRQVQ